MGKKILLARLMIIVSLLVGCSLLPRSVAYEKTKELAVENGIVSEGIPQENLLSVEEHNGETIVFFIKQDALGVASITKSIRGYRWYRISPLMIYDPTLEYYRGGLQIETEEGEIIKILAGAVNDPSIEKIALRSKGENEKQIIWNHKKSPSRFFYYILDDTGAIPEIVPVKYKQRD